MVPMKRRKAELRLDLAEEATAERDGNKAIEPGKPEVSELVARIFADKPSKLMPPPKTGHKLTAEQKDLLKRWIEQGASL